VKNQILHLDGGPFKTEMVAMTQTCNPSYSRGRDQEDHGSKPAQANGSTRAYLENTQYKKD
jgi:hypothetical protein